MRLGSAIGALAGALLLVAGEQAALARDPAAAEALFRAGRAAIARGDWASACDQFAESQRLDPAPGTLINLGDCKVHLGLLASGWASYHEAADNLAGDARLDMVKRKMSAVEPRLSRLTIVLAPGAPAGATVARDGEPLGPASLGVALPIDPGTHAVAVTAPGRAPRETTVEIGEREAKSVRVMAGEALPELRSQVPPSPAPGPSSALLGTGAAIGVLGVAGLVVGAATGVMTLQRKSVVQAQCPDQACSPQGLQAAADGRTLSVVSTATFVAGAAALGAGVAMMVLGSRSGPVVAPTLGQGSAGLLVIGTF